MKFWRNKKLVFGILVLTVFSGMGINNVFAQSVPGAYAGAAAGAATGAVAGSVIPGVGTAVGAFGGGIIGGLVGMIGGGDIIGGIAAKGIGWVAAIIGYIFGFIAAAVFYIGGQLVNLSLNLNDRLLADGSIVHVGWPIVLNFTNLGFVLAIIVMAFATIFRVQSYAMKQTLWKLIVAALLVNFSLVIAGAFINVADIVTKSFISKSMPTGVTDFSETLASLFKAQQFLKASDIAASKTALEGLGEFSGALLGFIAQIFFAAAFTFLGALTLLALAMMLLIRYVYLSILLILSPIVWLLWIFPATQKHWQKWWDNFLRWTFFAPVISFFLYLTVVAMKNYPKYAEDIIKVSETAPKSGQIGVVLGLDIIGNLAIVIGLLVGGLFAANSIGITFASTTYGWAQSVGKNFGGWVGRKGIRLGTLPLRAEPGRKLVEGMQKTGLGMGRAGRFITTPVRMLGKAISGTAGIGVTQGEKLVSQAEGELKKLQSRQIALGLDTMPNEKQIAGLNILRERKDLDLVSYLERYLTEKKKKTFATYGREGNFGDLEKATGLTAQAVEAAKKSDEKGTYDELAKLYQGMRPSHFATMQVDDLFGVKPKLLKDLPLDAQKMVQQQGARAILEANPEGLANVYRGLKGRNITEFHDKFLFKYISEQAKTAGLAPAEYLKEKHPKVYSFYTSQAAQGLGIGIEPVRKEPVEKEKKTILYDQFGRPIT